METTRGTQRQRRHERRGTTTEGTWVFLKRIHGGHKFFKLLQDPMKIGVADDSGANPDDTDDGRLFLNREGAIRAFKRHISIPLVYEDGTESSSTCSMDEALWVSSQFGLPIVSESGSYTVLKEDLGETWV